MLICNIYCVPVFSQDLLCLDIILYREVVPIL